MSLFRFYEVLQGSTGFYKVRSGSTRFVQVLQGSFRFYRVLRIGEVRTALNLERTLRTQ